VIVVLFIIAAWLIGVPLLYTLNLWVIRIGEPVGSLGKASKRTTFLFTFWIWTYTVTGLLVVDEFPSNVWAPGAVGRSGIPPTVRNVGSKASSTKFNAEEVAGIEKGSGATPMSKSGATGEFIRLYVAARYFG
jgi:hypothetical protein